MAYPTNEKIAKLIAYIRKTDALHLPWYVEYEVPHPSHIPVCFTADGFETYGQAHAHATNMGAKIVDATVSPAVKAFCEAAQKLSDLAERGSIEVGALIGEAIGGLFGKRDGDKPIVMGDDFWDNDTDDAVWNNAKPSSDDHARFMAEYQDVTIQGRCRNNISGTMKVDAQPNEQAGDRVRDSVVKPEDDYCADDWNCSIYDPLYWLD